MKQVQNHPQSQAALLRSANWVDAPVKNSLCCAAAAITAFPSSTTEALIPHEKLRRAAHTEATLIAKDRPLAQPAVGYAHPDTSSVTTSQAAVDEIQIEERNEFEKEFPVPKGQEYYAQRSAGFLIENRPAIVVMVAHDAPSTLHYSEPHYIHAIRVRGSTKGRYHRHELIDAQQPELLVTLKNLAGMVIFSGYPNNMYDQILMGWTHSLTSARISTGSGGATRQESLWINPACMNALRQTGFELGATE